MTTYEYAPHTNGSRIRQTLRYRRIDILAIAAFFACVGAAYSLWTPPHYRYSATLSLNPTSQASATDLGSEIAILTSASLIASTLNELGPTVEIQTEFAPYLNKLLPESMITPQPEVTISYLDEEKPFYDQPTSYLARNGRLMLAHKELPHPDVSIQAHHIAAGQTITLTPRRKFDYIRRIHPRLEAVAANPQSTRVITVRYSDPDAATARRLLTTLIDTYINDSRERQLASLRKSMSLLENAVTSDKQLLFEKEQQWRRLQSLEKLKNFQSSIDTLYAELASRTIERDARMASLHENAIHDEKWLSLKNQTTQLEKQIAQLSAEYAKYEGLKRDIEQLRHRFDMNHQAMTQLTIRASEMLGYTSILDMPDTRAEMVGTSFQNMVIISGLAGYVLGCLWFALRVAPSYKGGYDEQPQQPNTISPDPSPTSQRVFV